MKNINQKVAADMNLLLKTAKKIKTEDVIVLAEKKCCSCDLCNDKCSCNNKCSECQGCQKKKKEAGKIFLVLNKIAEQLDNAGLEKSAAKGIKLLENLSKEASGIDDIDDSIELQLSALRDLDLDLDGDVEEDIDDVKDKKKLEEEADKFLAQNFKPTDEDEKDFYFNEKEFNSQSPKSLNLKEDFIIDSDDNSIDRFDKARFWNLTQKIRPYKGNPELYNTKLFDTEENDNSEEVEFFSEEGFDDLKNELINSRLTPEERQQERNLRRKMQEKKRKAASKKVQNKIAGFFDDQGLFSDKDFNSEIGDENTSKSKKRKNKSPKFQLLRKILKETPEVKEIQKEEKIPDDIFNETEEDIFEESFYNTEKDSNSANDGIDACDTCGCDHGLEYELLSENELKQALQAHQEAGDYEELGIDVPDFLSYDSNDISDNLAKETDELLWKLKNDRSILNSRKGLKPSIGKLPSEKYFDEENTDENFDFQFNDFKNDELEKYIPDDVSDKRTAPPGDFESSSFNWEPEDPEIGVWPRNNTELLPIPKHDTFIDEDDEESIPTQRKLDLIDNMKAANRKLDKMLKSLASEESETNDEEDEDFEDEE